MEDQHHAAQEGGGREERRERDGTRPRIYVASLSDYNAGRLHGAWLDATEEPEALAAEVEAMLAISPTPGAEEWAIHDHEGFGPLHLGEYEPLERVSALGQAIAEHGLAFARWVAYRGGFEPEEQRRFEDAFLGAWRSTEDFAEHLLDDLGVSDELERLLAGLPETYRSYVRFDVEAFAHDLEIELYVVGTPDGVEIFDPNA